VVTPNGLNSYHFAALHEFQTMHADAKKKIEKFIIGHFHGFLDFDLDKTLYIFTAGRYEFRNKGCDLFIESLARLNHMLKETHPDVTVVAFIIMPAPTNSYNVGTLAGQASTKRHQDTVAEIKSKVGDKIWDAISRGKMPKAEDLLDSADRVKLKRCIYSSQPKSLPPVVTHNMVEDPKEPDAVLANLRRCELYNRRSDRVKVRPLSSSLLDVPCLVLPVVWVG
jgi:glycogen(starch) synthase